MQIDYLREQFRQFRDTQRAISGHPRIPSFDVRLLTSKSMGVLIRTVCSNRLVIYRQPNTKRCIIKNKLRRWPLESNQKHSGEPGVIHPFDMAKFLQFLSGRCTNADESDKFQGVASARLGMQLVPGAARFLEAGTRIASAASFERHQIFETDRRHNNVDKQNAKAV